MVTFSVILSPPEVEYKPLIQDASSPLWKINVKNLKKLRVDELIKLYYSKHASTNFKRMIVHTLSVRRVNQWLVQEER